MRYVSVEFDVSDELHGFDEEIVRVIEEDDWHKTRIATVAKDYWDALWNLIPEENRTYAIKRFNAQTDEYEPTGERAKDRSIEDSIGRALLGIMQFGQFKDVSEEWTEGERNEANRYWAAADEQDRIVFGDPDPPDYYDPPRPQF